MKITTEQYLIRARETHGDLYDYSETVYINRMTKVKIICRTHGVFKAFPGNHYFVGTGCPECSILERGFKKPVKKDLSDVIVPKSVAEEFKHDVFTGCILTLPGGLCTLIDPEDAQRVLKYRWIVRAGYVITSDKTSPYRFLHRFIFGENEKGLLVDHINRNPLDNRKCNLRASTYLQNNMNSKAKKGGTSLYKGVYFDKRCKKWLAKITLNAKTKYIGLYVDEIEAAKAYDLKAQELFGEFAYLNFPEKLQIK